MHIEGKWKKWKMNVKKVKEIEEDVRRRRKKFGSVEKDNVFFLTFHDTSAFRCCTSSCFLELLYPATITHAGFWKICLC